MTNNKTHQSLIPPIVELALEKEHYHVFAINNPIVLLVTCLAISEFKIPLEKVIIVPARRMDCAILKGCNILNPDIYDEGKLDRIRRALGEEPVGTRIRNILESEWGYFLLYTYWASPRMRSLIASNKCIGHIYLEEGDLAHLHTPQRKENEQRMSKIKNFHKSTPRESYLCSCSAYLSFAPGAFPFAPPGITWQLNNYEHIFKFYNPKLLNQNTIALVPFVRKELVNWQLYWDKISQRSNDRICLQLHPNYNTNKTDAEYIFRSLNDLSNQKFSISPPGTILEAEMMVSNKKIIGTPSSLKRYAEALGSEYILIELPSH